MEGRNEGRERWEDKRKRERVKATCLTGLRQQKYPLFALYSMYTTAMKMTTIMIRTITRGSEKDKS